MSRGQGVGTGFGAGPKEERSPETHQRISPATKQHLELVATILESGLAGMTEHIGKCFSDGRIIEEECGSCDPGVRKLKTIQESFNELAPDLENLLTETISLVVKIRRASFGEQSADLDALLGESCILSQRSLKMVKQLSQLSEGIEPPPQRTGEIDIEESEELLQDFAAGLRDHCARATSSLQLVAGYERGTTILDVLAANSRQSMAVSLYSSESEGASKLTELPLIPRDTATRFAIATSLIVDSLEVASERIIIAAVSSGSDGTAVTSSTSADVNEFAGRIWNGSPQQSERDKAATEVLAKGVVIKALTDGDSISISMRFPGTALKEDIARVLDESDRSVKACMDELGLSYEMWVREEAAQVIAGVTLTVPKRGEEEKRAPDASSIAVCMSDAADIYQAPERSWAAHAEFKVEGVVVRIPSTFFAAPDASTADKRLKQYELRKKIVAALLELCKAQADISSVTLEPGINTKQPSSITAEYVKKARETSLPVAEKLVLSAEWVRALKLGQNSHGVDWFEHSSPETDRMNVDLGFLGKASVRNEFYTLLKLVELRGAGAWGLKLGEHAKAAKGKDQRRENVLKNLGKLTALLRDHADSLATQGSELGNPHLFISPPNFIIPGGDSRLDFYLTDSQGLLRGFGHLGLGSELSSIRSLPRETYEALSALSSTISERYAEVLAGTGVTKDKLSDMLRKAGFLIGEDLRTSLAQLLDRSVCAPSRENINPRITEAILGSSGVKLTVGSLAKGEHRLMILSTAEAASYNPRRLIE